MASDSTVFVDTNVLLYSRDLRVPEKQKQAHHWLAQLWERRRGRVSVQVLQEFYANATRKLMPALTEDEARIEARRFFQWHPWATDTVSVELAWDAQRRWQISWWDALIVVAAHQQGCRYLLTEDMQHGQVLDGLQVVNPFTLGPELLDTTA
jgi:predicted nucleic acid-binding protein